MFAILARFSRLLPMAAVMILASCTGSRVVGGEPATSHVRANASWSFSGRDARVVIIGDPFGNPTEGPSRAALEGAVVRAMSGRAMGLPTNFTTTPGESARPGARVVFAFNPVGNGLTSRVCQEPPVVTGAPTVSGPGSTPGAAADVYVEAAFCDGGAVSTARGWLSDATSVDQPGFRSLIGDLTSTLFQPSDQDRCLFGDC